MRRIIKVNISLAVLFFIGIACECSAGSFYDPLAGPKIEDIFSKSDSIAIGRVISASFDATKTYCPYKYTLRIEQSIKSKNHFPDLVKVISSLSFRSGENLLIFDGAPGAISAVDMSDEVDFIARSQAKKECEVDEKDRETFYATYVNTLLVKKMANHWFIRLFPRQYTTSQKPVVTKEVSLVGQSRFDQLFSTDEFVNSGFYRLEDIFKAAHIFEK